MNMKKIVSLIALAFYAYAGAVSTEVSLGAFFPTNSTVGGIYGSVWPEFAVTVDHIQPFQTVPQISFFGEVEYLFSDGNSLVFKQATAITLVPIAAGLKWIQPLSNHVEVYVGLAPKYYFMHISNSSDFVPASSHQSGCGVYATAGTFLYPTEHCMIDIFLNYSYMNFKAPASTLTYTGFGTNVSGFNLGAGIGWEF